MKHALKIENLPVHEKQANSIVLAIRNFLLDLGYSQDRISDLECRSRDGFIPYSHNFGGLGAVAFDLQDHIYSAGGTGFENADATIERYFEFDLKSFEESYGKKYQEWTKAQHNEFQESRCKDTEADVLFSVDVMHTGVERGIHSLNIRMCVCVKDAPYHREYDDLLDIDLTFRTLKSLKKQLKQVLSRKDVKQFANCLRDAY